MNALQANQTSSVNGLDVGALYKTIEAIRENPAEGLVQFTVRTEWKGQTRSESSVDSFRLGGKEIKRSFKINADEPLELLGENTSANPQELLMAALNACITVGYVAGAAIKGITLRKLDIETSGELDLRGFLGIDANVIPGYQSIRYIVRIAGNGTTDEFRQIHENVIKTSPNYFNLSRPVRLEADLRVES
jgi:uncharacterized OsmC-like protein